MATRTHTIVIDDLDAGTDGVTTHRFSLDGVTYEIDLSAGNLDRLHAALAPFTAAARPLPKQPTRVTRVTRRTAPAATARRGDNAAVRVWWAANADRLDLPAHRERGVVPARVHQEYDADR